MCPSIKRTKTVKKAARVQSLRNTTHAWEVDFTPTSGVAKRLHIPSKPAQQNCEGMSHTEEAHQRGQSAGISISAGGGEREEGQLRPEISALDPGTLGVDPEQRKSSKCGK
ncbi:hypothetical protein FQN60_011256, partial [Etheostoma spectabile]